MESALKKKYLTLGFGQVQQHAYTPSHCSRYNPPCKTAKFLHRSVVFFLYSNWFSPSLRL